MPGAPLPSLDVLTEIVREEIVPQLNPTDRAMFARAGDSEMQEHVVSSGLPRAGTPKNPLKLMDFLDSVDNLKWALRASGAQVPPRGKIDWGLAKLSICTRLAKLGNMKVLQWVRKQDPPPSWNHNTATAAMLNGHTDILELMGRFEAERTGFDTLVNFRAGGFGRLWSKRYCHMLIELFALPDRETDQQKAASNGNVQILKFMHRAGLPPHHAGALDSLDRLVDRDTDLDFHSGPPYCFDRETVLDLGDRASYGGHRDALMWLCEGFPLIGWDFEDLRGAVTASTEFDHDFIDSTDALYDDLHRLEAKIDEDEI